MGGVEEGQGCYRGITSACLVVTRSELCELNELLVPFDLSAPNAATLVPSASHLRQHRLAEVRSVHAAKDVPVDKYDGMWNVSDANSTLFRFKRSWDRTHRHVEGVSLHPLYSCTPHRD